ncbi:4'-phosphopantetheinyl transferase family protein [Streptomyces alanosinicus]|uniref:4'-phosphopantetheinyl transferase n=1 Tax=Streptomyces alanosinicus TaxID=68171 RepID=A0A919D785_9ACTN|nr:4'-phosphopantetheinyl transferase superfamily protein [Streptomyces alanosinicus]GHE13889.1 4'-phosphopantetheinyl transferase [Streptomyces alanosinicus]
MTSLMRRLLPDHVEVTEVRGELVAPPLFPEEEVVVAQAVDKRRREFATGRRCARLSLSALGIPAVPLPPGPHGEPGWPAGVVGAISHCDGYRVAAVARATDLVALGIDAEPAAPLPDGVLKAVSLPEERAGLARLRGSVPQVPWDRLLFSAKESVYKVWFPLTRRPLGFEQARLRFTHELDATGGVRGTFSARLLIPVPPAFAGPLGGGAELTGRWLVDQGLVLTTLTLAAHPAGNGPRVAEPVDRTPADTSGTSPAPTTPLTDPMDGSPRTGEPVDRAAAGAPGASVGPSTPWPP